MVKRIEKSADNAKKFSGIANLIVDREIKYSELRKILFTVAERATASTNSSSSGRTLGPGA